MLSINKIVTVFESCIRMYSMWNSMNVEVVFKDRCSLVCKHNCEVQSSRESMNRTTMRKIQESAKNHPTVLVKVGPRYRKKVTTDSVGQRKRRQEIVTKTKRKLIRMEDSGRKLRIKQSQDKAMKRKGKSSGSLFKY